MTGAEFLFLLAISYLVVAPDNGTLRVTRGVAGAVRAGMRGRPTAGGGGAGKGKSKGKSKGGSAPTTSRRRAMLDGWREGVTKAATARAEGRDSWSRASRTAGRLYGEAETLTGHARRYVDQRRARKAAGAHRAGADRATDSAGQGPDVVQGEVIGEVVDDIAGHTKPSAGEGARTNTDSAADDVVDLQKSTAGTRPAVGETGDAGEVRGDKEMGVATAATELESLDAVDGEVSVIAASTEDASQWVTEIKNWAASLPERWAGTDWSTQDLDAAIAGVGEVAAVMTTLEPLLEQLAAVRAACAKARSLGEMAAEHGASGDVTKFKPAA